LIRKLRILFTFSGIILLLGTIFTEDWNSTHERLSFACVAICILFVCQPSACIRISKWLWGTAKSLFHAVHGLFNGTSFSKLNCSEDNCSEDDILVAADPGSRNPSEYRPRAKITQGNISTLSDEEMAVFLQYYYKADEIRTKVKGVTFRNDDGTDRQTILVHCHAGDQLRFKLFEYDGAPAYAVYCDWGQIGNLSAELAEEIAAREKPCIILGEILNVSGGYRGNYFGCNILINIYEKY